MSLQGIRSSWKKLTAKVSNVVVQDCPPELAACQICNKLDCQSEEWLRCETRLAAKRFLDSGDRRGLERLKLAESQKDAARAKEKRPSAAS